MDMNYGKRQVYSKRLETLENKPWKMIYRPFRDTKTK